MHNNDITAVARVNENVVRDRTVEDLLAALRPLLDRGRRDIHAVKLRETTHTQKAGETSCVYAPLTDDVMRAHLRGLERHGMYLMPQGATTTRVALWDLDSHKGETPWHVMQATALKILVCGERRGLRLVPFRSGGGAGIHLISTWDEPQDAYSARQLFRSVLAECGLRDGNGGVSRGECEVFPKQDVGSKCGHMFYLPLGGKSVPLDEFELDDMPRDSMIGFKWPMSANVPLVERPVYEARQSEGETVGFEQLQLYAELLHKHGAKFDYEVIQRLNAAFYHVSAGDERAMHLFERAIEKFPGFDPSFTQYKWDSYGRGYAGATAGIGTIKTLAAQFDRDGANAILSAEAESDFSSMPAVPNAPAPLPAFNRTEGGKIKAELNNVLAAVARPDVCGVRLGYDTFRDEIMLARPGTDEWRPFTDDDYVQLRSLLERGAQGFAAVGRELIRDAVSLASKQLGFDSAILWLESLKWDGVPRIEQTLTRYFGAEDTEYSRAVSVYLWTALAGRVLDPGCKADMAPVAVGKQGARKSSTIAAIAPAADHFLEMDLSAKDDDLSRLMRGKLVIELGELQGLRSRALEHIKAFITKQNEQWVPKFKEMTVRYPRRGVFFGSTNEREFLADPTGNRRWLPFDADRCDPDAMARDRLQLWAEGAVVFRERGIVWSEAEKLAVVEHKKFLVTDPWDDAIALWLKSNDHELGVGESETANGDTPFTSAMVLRNALHLHSAQIGAAQKIRLAGILDRMGYENRSTTVNGKDGRYWRKKRVG